MRSGHSACPGCGQAISMRLVLRAIGAKAIVVTVPSCVSVIAGPFPNAAINVPMYHAAFEVAAASAAGALNRSSELPASALDPCMKRRRLRVSLLISP